MSLMPSLFVTHGAPTLAIEDGPARRFLSGYGGVLDKAHGRPKAILVVSAHYEESVAKVTSTASPETIYDFRGFPEALYAITYPAPGDPALATEVTRLLNLAGIPCQSDGDRGLDHGAWIPLMLMHPAADIPVVQLSINPAAGPAYHLSLGEVLRPLRETGVLILGSGSLTHNLAEYFSGGFAHDAAAPDWVTGFSEWVAATIKKDRSDDLVRYRQIAPHGARNHPTDEHYLPLLVAAGAAGPGEKGQRLHHSVTYGVIAMDAYAFG